MRTRSATRAAGLSPGREHVLPPPTRKKRAPRAKKESGAAPAEPAASSEPLPAPLTALITGGTRAILLEWLYIFFLLLFLDAMLNKAAPVAPAVPVPAAAVPAATAPAPAPLKRAAEGELPGRPSVRRRLAPSAATPPPPSKTGGAVRRLLAAVASPRPAWGLRKLWRPLSPIVEAPAGVMETTVPVIPDRKWRRHDRRKRSPSPEVIPNPPGTSYGMWDKYFTCPSSSSEEENDVDVDMKDATPTPDPSTIRYPHNTSGEGVFCVNLDDILDAAEIAEAELAEKEAAELAAKEQTELAEKEAAELAAKEQTELAEKAAAQLAEKEQTELAEKAAAQLAEKEQTKLAEVEPATIIPDALARARALALKHKPETSSRLRFVERLSTSTVATDFDEEMGILTQAEKDEVFAAVVAIPEVDLIQFSFPTAPVLSAAQDEIWRAVTAAAAGTPNREVLPLFG